MRIDIVDNHDAHIMIYHAELLPHIGETISFYENGTLIVYRVKSINHSISDAPTHYQLERISISVEKL